MHRIAVFAIALSIAGCSGDLGSGDGDDGGGGDDGGDVPAICAGVDCSGHGRCFDVGGAATCQCDGGYVRTEPTACAMATGPSLGGCPLLPVDHIFNTPIDALPVHPDSDAFIATIGGSRKVHLDLGTRMDQQASDYYGIPYNVVDGRSFSWPVARYASVDPDLDWDPRPESDCAVGSSRTLVRPCTAARAPAPVLPIPTAAVVEGGVDTSADHLPAADHHILVLDSSSCVLWETYHSYLTGGVWNIFGSAAFDLRSNELRPDSWTSADAAGFPILPLLLRADEANSGEIRHALRFTINSNKIRAAHVWPARHLTTNGTSSSSLPAMGQLFRLKASYAIPASYNAQARAILQAMKTYGMYIADGGSDMYVSGAPSAAWQSATFSQVQSVPASAFEAVDLGPIRSRSGFDADSGAVP
jgi:hypothetical protein